MEYQKVDIDTLYSPSKWCRRFDGEGSIRFYKNFVTKGSNHVRNTIPCELNYQYGKDDQEKLDIYGHNLPKGSPVFIFIHGGYWQEYSKDDSCYMAEMFYQNKIKTIVIGFRNCPIISLEGVIFEVINGIKQSLKMAEEWNSQSVVIAGHSSGAHLLSCFLQQIVMIPEKHQKLIKGLFLISGIYDIVPLVDTYANDVMKLTKADAECMSPIYKSFSEKRIPVYVIVPEYDSPAFLEQSKKFYDKLKDVDKLEKIEFLQIKNEDHFKIVEKLTDESYELSKLILKLLI